MTAERRSMLQTAFISTPGGKDKRGAARFAGMAAPCAVLLLAAAGPAAAADGTSPSSALPLPIGAIIAGDTATAAESCPQPGHAFKVRWFALPRLGAGTTLDLAWTDGATSKNRLAVFAAGVTADTWCNDGVLVNTVYQTPDETIDAWSQGGRRSVTLPNVAAGTQLLAIFASSQCQACVDVAGPFTITAATSTPPPPSAPSIAGIRLRASTSVAVDINPPEGTYGFPVSSYTVTCRPLAGGPVVSRTRAASLVTVGGLADRTTYTCTARARTRGGDSPESAPSPPITTRTGPKPPPAPLAVRAAPGVLRAFVTWRVPRTTGGSRITGYVATAFPGGATCATTGAGACWIEGLSNALSYRFTVTAANRIGRSAPSGPSAAVRPFLPLRVVSPRINPRALVVPITAPATGRVTVLGVRRGQKAPILCTGARGVVPGEATVTCQLTARGRFSRARGRIALALRVTFRTPADEVFVGKRTVVVPGARAS